MHKQNATYLAFDFGTKKIGIAVGQSLTKTSRALPKISAKNGVPNWDIIKKIISEWKPIAFIVGIPLNMDGTEQKITQLARNFARHLTENFSLPVYEIDERLSTVAAKSELFESGGYKALLKKDIDSVAAQILLESWLRENC